MTTSREHQLSTANKYNRGNSLTSDIRDALLTKPNEAGTLHGSKKVHQGCRGRRTSLFPSFKNQGAMPLQSQHELGYALLLEQNILVSAYRTRSIKIELPRSSDYFPDFLIETTDHRYEIHDLASNYDQEWWRAGNPHAEKQQVLTTYSAINNVIYKLIDIETIPSPFRIAKLKYHYLRGHQKRWKDHEITLATKLLTSDETLCAVEGSQLLIDQGLDARLFDYCWFHSLA